MQGIVSKIANRNSNTDAAVSTVNHNQAPRDGSDVLGEMLETVHPKATFQGPLVPRPPWAVSNTTGDIQVYIIIHGKCLLEVEGRKSPTRLDEGDMVLIAQKKNHRLCDDLTSLVTPLEQITSYPSTNIHVTKGQSDATVLVSGSLTFESSLSYPLLSLLPSVVHIQSGQDANLLWMHPIVQLIAQESAAPRPGTQTIVNRLSQVILIHAIRTHFTHMTAIPHDKSSALLDPQIGQALRLIHQYPARPWTVASLAAEIGMSRSVFAARFHALVGRPPLHYLLEYRMTQACTLLRNSSKGIKEIASKTGYTSEAAFSNAFKRWAGTAPGSYRATARKS